MPIQRSMRHACATIALILLACAAVSSQARAEEAKPASLFDFEDGAPGWRALDEGTPSGEPCQTAEAPDVGGQALRVDARLPGVSGAGVAFTNAEGRWHRFTGLSLKVYVPPQAPEKVQAVVYLKDSDLYYYQCFRPNYLPCGQWTELDLDLTARSADWLPGGHSKPWDGYCREDVLEFGVKFISEEAYEGPLLVDSIALKRDEDALLRQNAIYNLRANRAEIGRYEKLEVSFNLARTYENPFDPEQVDVRGRFICPDGSTVSLPGFFYQGYLRRMEHGAEVLVPTGQSQWKIRFAPLQLGTYHYYVEVDDGERIRSELDTFRCVPSGSHGFVRISRTDPNYFEFDDGTFYFAIGQNIASVHDERARVMGVNLPAAEGTYAYDRFLSKMGANGETFGRVWMSPWSFGIEWTKAYDAHYRGLGRYNLCNAWRLDHVVESAREHGVYLMLLFTSHGELSAQHESDFKGSDPQQQQGSPYWDKYGGPIAVPTQIYSSPEALKLYKRKARYIAARWGYATSIMAWEVLNEADLGFGGAGDENVLGRQSAEFVRQVLLHVREHDPAHHMATSGMWQHTHPYAAPTLALNELDFFAGHIFNFDLGGQIAGDQRFIKERYNKVLLVTEAGLTPFAQDPVQTERAMHSALWTSYLLPLPGTACPWWWVLIDQRDLYGDFGGLAAFAKGEDRRGKGYVAATAQVKDLGSGRALAVRCLKNDTRAFCWVYNALSFSPQAYQTQETPAGATVTLSRMQDGAYAVEVWDTHRGAIVGALEAVAQGGTVTFELPAFAQDVACKVVRR